jgi:nicotinamidase-related amidase
MAVPALDPKTALLIRDLQKGIIGSPFIHPIGEVVERACALTDAFRGPAGRIYQRCRRRAGSHGETAAPRRSISCGLHRFCGRTRPSATRHRRDEADRGASTDPEAQLKKRSVTQVVTAGIATRTGVGATTRQGYEQEF